VGGKEQATKLNLFLRQSDCCHVNNRQGNKGGISTGMFLIDILKRCLCCTRYLHACSLFEGIAVPIMDAQPSRNDSVLKSKGKNRALVC